ncbi:unnamed protein product, partial [Porites lobata]
MAIPPRVGIFLIALNIFLSIFATLGNVLILVALRNVSSIHPPTKLLFRCLAITDLCVGLLGQPLYIYFWYITIFLDIGNRIVELVYLYLFIIRVLVAVSILTAAAISVDRLLALLLGLRYRPVVTLRRVRVVITCSLLASWWTYRAFIIFSIIVSTFSYTKIFLTLRHQQAQVQGHVQPEQSSTVRSVLNIARYKKTVYSVAWIQLAMFACYGPNIVMAFLWNFGNIDHSTEVMVAGEVSLCLIFLNSSLNPVLYCWRIKDIRQEVKNLIRKCLCLKQTTGCYVLTYSGELHIRSTVWIFLTALNIFLSIFATLGNVLILIALRNVSSIHPPTKLLFRCLAITDLCVGLLGQPLYVYNMYITNYLDIGNRIVELVYVCVFIISVSVVVSILTSAAISVDRLLALLLGLRYRHVVTLYRVRVIIACVWFIAVSNASLYCVASILSHYKLELASVWTLRAFGIFSIIVSTFLYTKIFFTLRHQQAQVRDHVQPEQSSRVRSVLNIARYKKTVYSVAWIQFAMLACYGPDIVMAFLLHFGNVGYSTEVVIAGEISLCLIFLNSSLNPVLYSWRIK